MLNSMLHSMVLLLHWSRVLPLPDLALEQPVFGLELLPLKTLDPQLTFEFLDLSPVARLLLLQQRDTVLEIANVLLIALPDASLGFAVIGSFSG
jgi:hypothetical protein